MTGRTAPGAGTGTQAGAADSVSVVTVTRGRPAMLRRAMASVVAQDHGGPIEHVVISDDDPGSLGVVADLPRRPGYAAVGHLARRPAAEITDSSRDRGSVYPRLARLLNVGIGIAAGTWVAFLDDDNEYEPGHLSSLLTCAAASRADAVHSGRAVVWADGSPYLEELFPGAPDPAEGARLYALMCDRGVWVRGTNILLDRADPPRGPFRNSTVMGPGDPVRLVDQSVWLVRRGLLARLPFPEVFTPAEIESNTCPDDKFLEMLLNNRVPIFSSRLPTVRYYLGGISNGAEQRDPERARRMRGD